ncbi:MAG TPA: hypothetical protein VFG04_02955 [Planctomycetaceae bacterium]|jgi:hypothetical protein|nr:hypothetical protein [Planctomycetaceae bacterium]
MEVDQAEIKQFVRERLRDWQPPTDAERDAGLARFRATVKWAQENLQPVPEPEPITSYVTSQPEPLRPLATIDPEITEAARSYAAPLRAALASYADSRSKFESSQSRLAAIAQPRIGSNSDLSVSLVLRNQIRDEIADGRVPRAACGEAQDRVDTLNARIDSAKAQGLYSILEPSALYRDVEIFMRDRSALRKFGPYLSAFAVRTERLHGNVVGERIISTLGNCGVEPISESNVYKFVCLPESTFFIPADNRLDAVVDLLQIAEATKLAAEWLVEREEKQEAERLAETKTRDEKREAERKRLLAILGPANGETSNVQQQET